VVVDFIGRKIQNIAWVINKWYEKSASLPDDLFVIKPCALHLVTNLTMQH